MSREVLSRRQGYDHHVTRKNSVPNLYFCFETMRHALMPDQQLKY